MRYYVSGHTSVGQPVFYCATDEEGVPMVSTDFDQAFAFADQEAAQRCADWLEESIFCGWTVQKYIEH